MHDEGNERWVEVAIAMILAALSFVPVPQVIGLADHLTQLPATLRLLHPALYPADLVMVYGNQDQLSFYTELLAAGSRIFTLEGVLLILAFGSRTLMAWGMLRLGRALGGSLRWGVLVAASSVVLPFFGTGGTTEVFELLYPRTIVGSMVPALLAHVVLTPRPRWLAVGAALGLAFIIHPLTAVPVVAVVGVALLWRLLRQDRRAALRVIVHVAAGYFLASSPLWWRLLFSGSDAGGGLVASSFSEDWFAVVAREENEYMFPGAWTLRRWIAPMAGLLLLCRHLADGSLDRIHVEWRRWSLAGAATVLGLVALTLVVLSVSPVPLVLQLQFGRSLYLIPMLALPLIPWLLARAEARPSWATAIAAFLAVLGLGSQHFIWLWVDQSPWIAVAANALLGAALVLDWRQARRPAAAPSVAPRWLTPGVVALGLLLPRLPDTVTNLGESAVFLPRGVHVLVMAVVAGVAAWLLGRGAALVGRRAGFGSAAVIVVGVLCLGGTLAREFHDLDRVGELVGVAELAAFAREHTPEDAVFAFEESADRTGMSFPPDQHFRLHGRRSVWLAHADHVPGIFFPALAAEWTRRMEHLEALAALAADDPSWAARLRGLGIDFYVAPRQLPGLRPVGVFDGRRAVYAVPRAPAEPAP